MKLIAVDSGFGFMKATDGKENIIYPNIACRGERQPFGEGFNNDVYANLDVMINDGTTDKHYFLGERAKSEGFDARYIRERDRVNSEYAQASLLTALALLSGDETEFIIATGLPHADYEALKDSYEQNMPGEYTVTFNAGPLKGVQKNIKIISARVYAQGMGVFFNEVLDFNGDPVDDHPLLGSDGVFGLIDIGMRTTNIELYEDRRINHRHSGGLERGMRYVHKEIEKALSKAEFIMPESKIEDLLQGKYPHVIKDHKLQPVIERAFKDIVSDIETKKNDLWAGKDFEIQRIYVAGGGGKNIFEYLPFKNKATLVSEPQFANVSGFYKALVRAVRSGKVIVDE